MANYVWNKVVCDKDTLDEYFIDYQPIEEGKLLNKPYITFNKMFGVKLINEYYEKFVNIFITEMAFFIKS